MKRILFFSKISLWSMDKNKGAPSFYRTVKGYVDDGWDVTLIMPETDHSINGVEGVRVLSYSLPFHNLCNHKKTGFLFKLFNTLSAYSAMYHIGKKQIQSRGTSLLYAYEVHGVKPAKKLSRRYHLPLVTRFQGTILAAKEYTLLNRIRYYPHFSALHESADITIMTDDGTLGDKVLERAGNHSKNIFFWKNGVDLPKKSPYSEEIQKLKDKYHIRPEDSILLTVSRLASWKRVDRAIKALDTVIQRGKQCCLVIVGDGDSRKELEELVNRLNLEGYVHFAGAVAHDEVYSYMNMADIFLSLYDLSNVGNPLLEALSCGKPVITLDVGDTSSVIQNDVNGVLLDINALNRVPEAIMELLDNPDYASRLGQAAKEYASQNFWSWNERIAAEMRVVDRLIV